MLPARLLAAAVLAALPAAHAVAGAPPAVCGDGQTEGFEDCDDGNLVFGDGCDATCCYEGMLFPLIVDDCARSLVAGFVRVVSAEARGAEACTRAIQRGQEPLDLPACLAADRSGRVARAQAWTAGRAASSCSGETTAGVTDAATVNATAAGAVDDAAVDLLEALVLRASDPEGARCQRAAIQGLAKLERAAAKRFGRERKDWTRTIVRTCDLPRLGEVVARALADEEVERVALHLEAKLARSCPTGDLGAWFGGAVDAFSASVLAASVADRGRCRVCLAVANSLVLALDCDAVDDGATNASCP